MSGDGKNNPLDPARAQGKTFSRRQVVGAGLKLAFVAPVVSTFLADEARAAGSNLSCYPLGHVCNDITSEEDCCPGLACSATPGTCQ